MPFEEISDDGVEAGYHFCRVVGELKVEFLVKLPDVFAFHLEDSHIVEIVKVVETAAVELLADEFSVDLVSLFEVQQEFFNRL